MNFRRGLFRLWLVSSALLLVFVIIFAYNEYNQSVAKVIEAQQLEHLDYAAIVETTIKYDVWNFKEHNDKQNGDYIAQFAKTSHQRKELETFAAQIMKKYGYYPTIIDLSQFEKEQLLNIVGQKISEDISTRRLNLVSIKQSAFPVNLWHLIPIEGFTISGLSDDKDVTNKLHERCYEIAEVILKNEKPMLAAVKATFMGLIVWAACIFLIFVSGYSLMWIITGFKKEKAVKSDN